jgi:hypothetical protein
MQPDATLHRYAHATRMGGLRGLSARGMDSSTGDFPQPGQAMSSCLGKSGLPDEIGRSEPERSEQEKPEYGTLQHWPSYALRRPAPKAVSLVDGTCGMRDLGLHPW